MKVWLFSTLIATGEVVRCWVVDTSTTSSSISHSTSKRMLSVVGPIEDVT
jgi:hypothetical protein